MNIKLFDNSINYQSFANARNIFLKVSKASNNSVKIAQAVLLVTFVITYDALLHSVQFIIGRNSKLKNSISNYFF